jgi:integrase
MRDEHGTWHEPDTEEGARIYWALRTGKAKVATRSWAKLIESYRSSDRWTRLKPRTRRDYEKILDYILEKNGSRDMTRLARKDVIAAMEANKHRVRFANYIAQVMMVLCERAIDIGWITVNPVKGVRLLEMPKEKKKPHTVWPDWACHHMRTEAEPLARLIFELGVGSVQRPGDLPAFTWGDYDGTSLRVVQSKTDVPLVLPCTDSLRRALDEAKGALGYTPLPSRPILTKRDGNPMSYDYLAQVMLDERKRLGLTAFDQHAMRYRGMQELARMHCTDEEIQAYSGHTSMAMVRLYTGPVRQEMAALRAKEKRR